jgi:hypothetical protein
VEVVVGKNRVRAQAVVIPEDAVPDDQVTPEEVTEFVRERPQPQQEGPAHLIKTINALSRAVTDLTNENEHLRQQNNHLMTAYHRSVMTMSRLAGLPEHLAGGIPEEELEAVRAAARSTVEELEGANNELAEEESSGERQADD